MRTNKYIIFKNLYDTPYYFKAKIVQDYNTWVAVTDIIQLNHHTENISQRVANDQICGILDSDLTVTEIQERFPYIFENENIKSTTPKSKKKTLEKKLSSIQKKKEKMFIKMHKLIIKENKIFHKLIIKKQKIGIQATNLEQDVNNRSFTK